MSVDMFGIRVNVGIFLKKGFFWIVNTIKKIMFYERFEMGRNHQITWRVYCVKSGVVSYKLHANTNIISSCLVCKMLHKPMVEFAIDSSNWLNLFLLPCS